MRSRVAQGGAGVTRSLVEMLHHPTSPRRGVGGVAGGHETFIPRQARRHGWVKWVASEAGPAVTGGVRNSKTIRPPTSRF